MSASEKNAFMHSANGECRLCAAFTHDIMNNYIKYNEY